MNTRFAMEMAGRLIVNEGDVGVGRVELGSFSAVGATLPCG